ncbi:MAG TPA: methyltransferase domain-containing protein [Bacteroidales bacterium]|nr:methyltransferase domain-containing protein [Bacteroidales bacterium]
MRESKIGFLRTYIPDSFYGKNKMWLDCASGDGVIVARDLLKERGIIPSNYICIDRDSEKLESVKKMGCKAVCIDLETSNIKEHVPMVDIILCLETLEHLEALTAERLVKDFISILVKGGMMIITFPINIVLEEKEGKCFNKHQPNIKNFLKLKEFFSGFIKTSWNKSRVLVFMDKK